MLIKYTGKYVNIYFSMKITFSSKLKNKDCFPIYFDVLNNFSSMHSVD